MPELTPTELEYLRSQIPHTAIVKWYVAVAPYGDPCFTARIDGDPENNRTIEYDTGTSNNVNASDYSGLTLWVGSEAGAYDKGRIRIKSITGGGALPPPAGTIVVAENDGIDWSDGDYLTCPGAYGFRELWSKFPRLTENGAVTFYEDYDDTFSDPADVYLPPKANAGPPVIATLEGGYVDVEFMADESISLEVGHGIDEYEWDFADGVVQSWGDPTHMGTCEHPNIVRFSSTGFRYVKLTVRQNVDAEAGDNRYASIYIPVWTFDDDDQPFTLQSIERFTADPGGSVTIKAFQSDTDDEDVIYDFPDRAMVVVFTKTTYDGVDVEVGGYCHRENVEYVGWLVEESLRTNSEFGTIEFEAADHIEILNRLNGWEFTLLDDDDPSDWYEIKDLNLDRSVHALLERRSTVNQIIHVNHVGEGSDRVIAIQPFPDTPLYRQIEDHLMADSMCTMLCGIQGVIHCTRDPQFMSEVERDLVDVVCHLTEDDVLNDLEEIRRHTPNIGYVKLGGFSYETPLMAEAPGTAPLQCHNSANVEGFIFRGQDEADHWAACWLAKENNSFPMIPVSLPGYWPVFDPARQEFVEITYTDKLGRNIWDAQKFIVREVEHERLPIGGTGRTNIVLEMLTDPGDGNSVDVPDPPEPEPPPPPPPEEWQDVPDPEYAIVHDSKFIYFTDNWLDLNPDWTDIVHPNMDDIFCVEFDQFVECGMWAITGPRDSAAQGIWYNGKYLDDGADGWSLIFNHDDLADMKDEYMDTVSVPYCCCNDPDDVGCNVNHEYGCMRAMVSTGPAQIIASEALHSSMDTSQDLRRSMIIRVDVDDGGTGTATAYNNRIAGASGYAGDGKFTGTLGCCEDPETCLLFYAIIMCEQHGPWVKRENCHQMCDPFMQGVPVVAGDYLMVWPDICDGHTTNWHHHPFPAPDEAVWTEHQGRRAAYQGTRALCFYDGLWYGIARDGDGTDQGTVYTELGEVLDTNVWANDMISGICAHPDIGVWWGKKVDDGNYNELLLNGESYEPDPIISDDIFGGKRPITYIRSVWTETGYVVMVCGKEFRGDDRNIVWTVGEGSTTLANKTGTLDGGLWGVNDWEGRTRKSMDNVGFTAPGVPHR